MGGKKVEYVLTLHNGDLVKLSPLAFDRTAAGNVTSVG
jgi:hypothetical protein